MQLAGGAGLAIIMMSAIVGPTGVGISSAEGRSDQLVPQVRQSARLVLMIYIGYAAAGTLAYWLAGMSLFDAVNHSFAAVSTGGFGTKPESIGHWDSPAVEAVSLPLMVLGNLSFVTAWLLWRGKFRFVARNGEVRLMAVIIPLAASAVFLFTCVEIYPHIGKSIRVARFRNHFRSHHNGIFDGELWQLERFRRLRADRAHAHRRRDLLNGRRHQAVSHLFALEAAHLGNQTLASARELRSWNVPYGKATVGSLSMTPGCARLASLSFCTW